MMEPESAIIFDKTGTNILAFFPVRPRVRLRRIVMDNFKSVQHGEVVFFGKKADPWPVITGLYGPNATGKTSVIDAINLLKALMNGDSFGETEMEGIGQWIRKGAEEARLLFEMEVLYPASESEKTERQLQNVVYSFSILPGINGAPPKFGHEEIRMGGDFGGRKIRMQPVFDTACEGRYGFGPASKVSCFIRKADPKLAEMMTEKKKEGNCSVPFSLVDEFVSNSRVIQKNGTSRIPVIKSEYLHNLLLIRDYIAVVKSNARDLFSSEQDYYTLLVFISRNTMLSIPLRDEFGVDQYHWDPFVFWFEKTRKFLHVLLPDIDLGFRQVPDNVTSPDSLPQKKNGSRTVRLYSIRDGREIPLEDESEGVLKLISMGILLFEAIKHDNICLVIDEIENGIFEYLLMQLIKLMQNYGHGQLIFTSHNFRILEVLPKENIWFTTTDAENRFVRMKYVAAENNLLKLYYRKLAMGDPDIEYYGGSTDMDILDTILSDDEDKNHE